MASSTYLNHAGLGVKLRGVLLEAGGANALQFRGLPYAQVRARFEFPQPIDLSETDTDCTEYGPVCPQNDIESERMSYALPDEQQIRHLGSFGYDELKCLNLVLTMPRLAENERRNLPVLVYMHGGGFARGTANHISEDFGPLVMASIRTGQPLIAVAINYRLNYFGFSPIPSSLNLGLYDQLAALHWVKTYISGFGGDPDQITLAGQSAGSISANIHLYAPISQGLFRRVIMMSALVETSAPRTLEQQRNTVLKRIYQILGMEATASESEKLEQYRRAPVDDLQRASEAVNVMALTRDGVFVPIDGIAAEYTRRTFPTSCDAVMLGECENESYYWSFIINGYETETFINVITNSVECDAAERLMEVYDINPDKSDEHNCQGVLQFLNDGHYDLHISNFCTRFPRQHPGIKVYPYAFRQPNPFDVSRGAHHQVDIMFGCSSIDFSATDAAALEVRRVWQEKLIMFVNGRKPWSESQTFVIGPKGNSAVIKQHNLDVYLDNKASTPKKERLDFLRSLGEENIGPLCEALLRGRPVRRPTATARSVL